MTIETPGESNEVIRPRLGYSDPDIVADALSFLIHGQMWPVFPQDEGSAHFDLKTPVIIDALTRRIYENPN